MHEHLEILLEVQDLKTQRRELEKAEAEREVEEQVFNIPIDQAIEEIDSKVEEMVASLPPDIRGRYERLSGRYPRAVVPAINGTCYGCFVSVATALSSDSERNQAINYCESCGRFLYLTG